MMVVTVWNGFSVFSFVFVLGGDGRGGGICRRKFC